MKLKITNLKAPWPVGAQVGHVVDIPGVPAWAVGKCEQVGDDEPVTLESATPAEPTDLVVSTDTAASAELVEQARKDALVQVEAFKGEAFRQLQAMLVERNEARESLANLQTQQATLVAEFDAQREKLIQADAKVLELTGKLAEVEAALEQAKAPASLAEADAQAAQEKAALDAKAAPSKTKAPKA